MTMPVDTAWPVLKHLIMIFGIEAPLAALEQEPHPGAPFRQWLLNCRWCFDAMNVEAREVRAFSPLDDAKLGNGGDEVRARPHVLLQIVAGRPRGVRTRPPRSPIDHRTREAYRAFRLSEPPDGYLLGLA